MKIAVAGGGVCSSSAEAFCAGMLAGGRQQANSRAIMTSGADFDSAWKGKGRDEG